MDSHSSSSCICRIYWISIGCWTNSESSKLEKLRQWVKLEMDYETSHAYMSGYDDCLKRFKFDRIKFLSNGPDFELRVWEFLSKDDELTSK